MYALWDDGNIAWETEEEEDEVTQEAMWRRDEEADGIGELEIEKVQKNIEAQANATTQV